MRDICNSHTYQRSVIRNETNESDERNFAHANPRRLRAEILLDCVSQVTGTQDKFRGLPLGARAVQIADGRTTNYFLTTFGRARRDNCSAAQVSTAPSLSQALHLLNGYTLNGKIRQGSLIQRWLADGKGSADVIEAIYIRALTRKPTSSELAALTKLVQQSGNAQQGLEDVFWSVLNSREFLFNH